MKVNVNCQLYCCTNSEIELPIQSWGEVKQWYVKWDTLRYTLDGDTWYSVELDSFLGDAVDWKRPISVEIMDEEMQGTLAQNGTR